jgi:hypothetical protein
VIAIEVLLDPLCLHSPTHSSFPDIGTDPLIHLLEQVGAARIESVIEVEDPSITPRKAVRSTGSCGRRASAVRLFIGRL